MNYKSLNDAAVIHPELAKGTTKIWYAIDTRNFGAGYKFLAKHMPEIIPHSEQDLLKTHALLGSIKETDLEAIYMLLQGENWSPKGEARELDGVKKSHHTSMSVGDIIQIGDKLHLVDMEGFTEIPSKSEATAAAKKEIVVLEMSYGDSSAPLQYSGSGGVTIVDGGKISDAWTIGQFIKKLRKYPETSRVFLGDGSSDYLTAVNFEMKKLEVVKEEAEATASNGWQKHSSEEYFKDLDDGSLVSVFRERDGRELKWCWEHYSPEGLDLASSASYFDDLQEAQEDADKRIVTKISAAVTVTASKIQVNMLISSEDEEGEEGNLDWIWMDLEHNLKKEIKRMKLPIKLLEVKYFDKEEDNYFFEVILEGSEKDIKKFGKNKWYEFDAEDTKVLAAAPHLSSEEQEEVMWQEAFDYIHQVHKLAENCMRAGSTVTMPGKDPLKALHDFAAVVGRSTNEKWYRYFFK